MHSKPFDILLITLPWWDMISAPLAPAVLKGILEDHNFTAKAIDFNVDLLEKFCHNNRDLYDDVGNYFIFNIGTHTEVAEKYYDHILNELKKHSFRYLGISVFSVYTHKSTLELCKKIKERYPDYKIVLGGRGLAVKPYLSITPDLTTAEKLLTFDQIIKKRKLADYFILGDGEDALPKFLLAEEKNIENIYNVIENKKLEYPFANFDDFNLEKYTIYGNKKQIPIISSKGCVRDCDFCDVAAQFQKYAAKSGKRLAEEMIYLAKKYDNYDFAMADSILNGNMKELKAACEVLKDFNSKSSRKIKWAGNWIARPPGSIKKDFFDLLRDAGLESVTIGAESGSNAVLKAMNKKTTVQGLYYELEHFHRCGIQVMINNVIAHWSETYENFIEHVDMFLQLGPYVANNTINDITLGSTFSILDDTPALTGPAEIISIGENFSHLWYTKKNPQLTLKARLARWYFLMKMSVYLKYWISRPLNGALTILSKLADKKTIDDFYNQHVDFNNHIPCPSISIMEQVESITDKLIAEKFKKSKIKIKVAAESFKGHPNLIIQHNDTILLNQELEDGQSEFEFNIENSFFATNNISMSLTNKDLYDTQVDDKGNIIRDKKIEIIEISIDDLNLVKDPEYFYQHLKYLEQGHLSTVKQGFYSNSTLIIEYNDVFWKHYLQTKNNKLTWRTTFSDVDLRLSKNLDKIKQEITNLNI